ncbi:MAG: phosphomannose isomerase type II C-terminal cupin domain [Candidatus Pacearchaeota archaeon]|jgi:mannose-6-phosphate isomerase-like protein (cupin superfamily)
MLEEKRPWGLFKTFAKNKKCTVKILEVKPYQELSLQKHKKREEHWYFLTSGFAQLGNKKKKVKQGEEVVIKKNTAHRIIAKKNKVMVLEVSLGHFSERDEIRLEDEYGRK